MNFIEIIKFIFGIVITLFIPGFIWTFVLFNKDDIDVLERIVLSFGISIAMIPLLIFFLHKLVGMKITALNSFLTIAIFCIVGVVCAYMRVKGWMKLEKISKSFHKLLRIL